MPTANAPPSCAAWWSMPQARCTAVVLCPVTTRCLPPLKSLWKSGCPQPSPALFDFSAAPDAVKYNHPGWFINELQQAYPDNWQAILDANQHKAPLWLRVNVSKIHPTDYAAALTRAGIDYSRPLADLPAAIKLAQAQDVTTLPGYSDGWFSVQDAAAQYAAVLLNTEDGQRVLDACCAPGGKSCHILELAPQAELTALDKDPKRLLRVHDNLSRLGLTATVIAADAAEPDSWWQGKQFDRILLDVPCSASGVIRRHPDIRWLRKKADIAALAELQQRILKQCWQLLAPGGTLLYATCSVLPQENQQQIARFLQQHSDAQLSPLPVQATQQHGWQLGRQGEPLRPCALQHLGSGHHRRFQRLGQCDA